MTNIYSETSSGWYGHGVATVAATAARLTEACTLNSDRGVVIQAPSTNVGPVYFGGCRLVAGSDADRGGLILEPGCSYTIPINKACDVFIVGTPGDLVHWGAL